MKKALNNKGAAMIAVLCIMAIFVTLCLSMLLTASVLVNKSQQRFNEEQCKVSAVTFSKEMEYDLCNDNKSKFYKYIDNNIDINNWNRWPYFNPDEINHGEQSPGVIKTITPVSSSYPADYPESNMGKMSVKLYWEFLSGGNLSDVLLHVDVTAERAGQQYTVKTVYNVVENSETKDWIWSKDIEIPTE